MNLMISVFTLIALEPKETFCFCSYISAVCGTVRNPVSRIRQCKFAVARHVYFHVLYYKSLSAADQEDKGPCLPVCVLPGSGGGRHA